MRGGIKRLDQSSEQKKELSTLNKKNNHQLKQLQKKINTKTDSLSNYEAFYQFYEQRQTTKEALNELEKVLKKFPEKKNLYLFLGKIYENKLHYDKAIRIYEQARKEIKNKEPFEEKLIQIYLSSRHYNELCIASWMKEDKLNILVEKALSNEDTKPIFLSLLSRLKKFPHEEFSHKSLLSIATQDISLAISLNKVIDQLFKDHYHKQFVTTLLTLGKQFHRHYSYLSCLLTSLKEIFVNYSQEESLFFKTEQFFKENQLSKEGYELASNLFEQLKDSSIHIHILCANLLISLNEIKKAHSLLQESITFFAKDIRLISIYTDLLIISNEEKKALSLIQKYPLILTLNSEQMIRWYHLYLKRELYFDAHSIYLKLKKKNPTKVNSLKDLNKVLSKTTFSLNTLSPTPLQYHDHLIQKSCLSYQDILLNYIKAHQKNDYGTLIYFFKNLKKHLQELWKDQIIKPCLENGNTELLFKIYRKNCVNYLFILNFCIKNNLLEKAFIIAKEARNLFSKNKEISLLFIEISEKLNKNPKEYKQIWKVFHKQSDFNLCCARILYQLNKIDKALYFLKKTIIKNPFHQDLYSEAYKIALTSKRRSYLNWCVEQGLKSFPDDEQVLLKHFKFHQEEKKTHKALVSINRLVSLFPNKNEYTHLHLQILWIVKDFKKIFTITRKKIKDKKDDAFILYIHGKVYYTYHKYNQSIFYLKKSLKKEPHNKDAQHNLFLCYCEAHDFSNALKFCPQKVNSILNLLNLLKRANEWQYARDLCMQALSSFAQNTDILKNSAQIFYRNKLNKKAEKCFLRLIKIDPKNKEYFSITLDFYLKTNQFPKAIILSQKSLEKWDNDSSFLKRMSLALYKQKDFESLSSIYLKRLEIDPYNQELYKTTILSLYKSKQFEKALNICLKGIDLFSYHIPLYRYASKICFKIKSYKKGIEILQKGLSYEDQQIWIFKDLSLFYLHLGKRSESIYHARMALQIDTEETYSYQFFSQVYMHFEEYDNASSLLQGAIKKWPSAHKLNELLYQCHQLSNQLDELEVFYNEFIDNHTAKENTYTYLFYTQYSLNKKKSAEMTLKEAKSIFTNNHIFLLLLGTYHYEQGKVKEASTLFENALSMTPNKKEPYAILYILYLKASLVDQAMVIYKKAQIKFPGSQDYFAKLYQLSSHSKYDEWTYHFILKFLQSGRPTKRMQNKRIQKAS